MNKYLIFIVIVTQIIEIKISFTLDGVDNIGLNNSTFQDRTWFRCCMWRSSRQSPTWTSVLSIGKVEKKDGVGSLKRTHLCHM